MLVGEAPGEEEEKTGMPFVGYSGQELNRMLHEVGIMRSECFVTNVCRLRPPDNDLSHFIAMKKKDITSRHIVLKDKYVLPPVIDGYNLLLQEVAEVRPKVIIPFGNLAMWALTGNWGITKWRGSHLSWNEKTAVIPTYHPSAILRQWEWRAVALNDLRRAKKYAEGRGPAKPDWRFVTNPNLFQVMEVLNDLRNRLSVSVLWIDFDLETRVGHISCAGISWSLTEALCIPFMCTESKEGYWNLEEETIIIQALREILTHQNVRVRWQNGLYDAQYTWRWWHFVPNGAQDTMISQHTMFCALPKSLAFQASMYANWYIYWKDEGKDFNTGGRDQQQGWIYNCEDCVYTRESGEVEQATIKGLGLEKVEEFQQKLFWPVLKAMQIGLRVDIAERNRMAIQLMEEVAKREQYFIDVLGHPLNVASPKQMATLFYEDLGQAPIWTRAKKGSPAHITCNDDALIKIGQREPILKPLVDTIADIRTLNTLLSTFVNAKLDIDGRMRCSFNIAGNTEGDGAPSTYRLSSSTNAFDSGANLQNIPSDKSKMQGKAARRNSMGFILPNIRNLYIPDPGYTFFDMDLDRADLQAMAWDADDELLKTALRMQVDVHLLNVYVLDAKEPPPMEELVETHPRYLDHRGPRKLKREFAKVFCHATDYLGKSRTVAAATGRTVHEVDRAQAIYLGAYKGIKRWQDRVINDVKTKRYVENKFGYRWYIFDRIDDSVMPEAVAWIPQSTVGVIINKAWVNIHENIPEVQVLLQVHDSLAGQFPTHMREYAVRRLNEESRIVVPYDDPLIIPVGIKTSEKSWGECQ